MIYREPQRRDRAALEADLGATSPDIVAAALVDAAHYSDASWVIGYLLDAVEDSRDGVTKAGLAALAALARRGVMPSDRRVWQTVLRCLDHPDHAGLAEDVLDDLEVYGTAGSRDRRPESGG